MKKEIWWRGVEGVTMIDHGDWSDPELKYGKVVAGYWDVEEQLAVYFSDDKCLKEYPNAFDDEFSEWCRENRDQVIELITHCQRGDNKYDLTFDMWDEILEEFSQDEYNYMLATLKYKKCKLSELENFGSRMEKVVDLYTEEHGLEFEWWKFDYATICTPTRCYLHGANIDSMEALVFAMEDGFI